MDDIEGFLDECRADPWFCERPTLLGRLEQVLTKSSQAGDESPEWQAICERVRKILKQKDETLIERCKALVPVLTQIPESELIA